MKSKRLSEKISISISSEKIKILKEVAKLNGITLSKVIRDIIDCERIKSQKIS